MNTLGFKASRITFKEMYSQSLRAASTPSATEGGVGGTNPMQVGLGTMVGSIDMNMSPSNIETTGNKSDLAIDGKGYFVLRVGDSAQHIYTRAGNFSLDGAGYLTHTGTGNRLQGYMLRDPDDPSSITGSVGDIHIPFNDHFPPTATTIVEMTGNLNHLDVPGEEDEEGAVKPNHVTQVEIFDKLGQPHQILMQFYQLTDTPDSPQWSVRLSMLNPYESIDPSDDAITLNFDVNGVLTNEGDERFLTVTLSNGGDGDPDIDGPQVGGFTEDMELVIDFGKITQVAGKNDVVGKRSDGNQAGKLTDWAVDQDGVVTLYYSNGERRNYARVAMALFANEAGLTKISDTTFMESNNSGAAVVSIPNSGDFGKVISSGVEMSNVDLAYEFTNLVITQRGYQANARVISTSDEILQELVNLKR